MRLPRGATLAWPLCGLALATGAGIVVLDVLDRHRIHSFDDWQPVGIVMAVSFSILGAVIVSRQPGNRIGWIFLWIGIAIPAEGFAAAYYERSVLSGGLPAADWAAWLTNWTTFVVFPTGLSLFAFLLFPSGRLPSARWRPVAWTALVVVAIGIVLAWLDSTPISVVDALPAARNPTGVGLLGWKLDTGTGVTAVYVIGMLLLLVVTGNLVLRGRRATLQERQQVKLLAYAALVTIAILLAIVAVSLAGVPVGNTAWDIPIALGFGVAVPAACGFAILKHGLYEIDRLISRTVSYAIVTGLLVALFVGLVVLTTRVLPFSSPVGVAASTLAAAALFNPLRVRVQRLVDRRFNRRRRDAEVAVAAFAQRLREAVDLQEVETGLANAVSEAFEPAHLGVWLRSTA